MKWLISGDVDIPVEKIYSIGLSQKSIYRFSKNKLLLDNIKNIFSGGVASVDPNKYVLIIDEINRGNISKIFGEAITLLDPDKRLGAANATTTTLPYSQKQFGLPSNLYLIGTMNTADRSIALMDIALRRRFEFKELMPDQKVVRKGLESNTTARYKLKKMNSYIR